MLELVCQYNEIAQTRNISLKLWLFYLVVQTNRLLDTDWLSPLMCNEIEMLLSLVRVVRMCCAILVVQLVSSTMMACSNVRWQGSKLQQSRMDGGIGHVNRLEKCTHGHSLHYIITNDEQS